MLKHQKVLNFRSTISGVRVDYFVVVTKGFHFCSLY